MALVVFDTLCILACGFYLYVLLHWRREDQTALRFAADKKSRRGIRKARLNVVSFREDANSGENRPSGQAQGRERTQPANAEGSPNSSANELRTSGSQGQGLRGTEDREKRAVFRLRSRT